MTKIKICGIRREADVEILNKFLPDYAGFVFARSKRQVSIETVKLLAGLLDRRIKKVGIFVNETIESVLEKSIECKLDAIQLHGDETPDYVSELKQRGIEIWKAIRVKNDHSLIATRDYNADKYVLDCWQKESYGGTGMAFDWNIAAEAERHYDIILAGGLDSMNVGSAINTVRPFAVDVSSGVETDGWKDERKIKDFIDAVGGNRNGSAN